VSAEFFHPTGLSPAEQLITGVTGAKWAEEEVAYISVPAILVLLMNLSGRLLGRFGGSGAIGLVGRSVFGRVRDSVKFPTKLLLFLLLLNEFSSSLLELVIRFCQTCSSLWLFRTPSRETPYGLGQHATCLFVYDIRLVAAVDKSPLSFFCSPLRWGEQSSPYNVPFRYTFAHTRLFSFTCPVEVAGAQGFATEEPLLLERSFAVGQIR
jgi:hypothetical protein